MQIIQQIYLHYKIKSNFIIFKSRSRNGLIVKHGSINYGNATYKNMSVVIHKTVLVGRALPFSGTKLQSFNACTQV